MTSDAPSPYVIVAGRAWTLSLFVLLGLAVVSGLALTVLEPSSTSFVALIVVMALVGVTTWRGWGRVCDQMVLDESGVVLRTLWPPRSVNLDFAELTRVWMSPNSGTLRLFTAQTSFVLRIRGDRIDADLEDRLVQKLSSGVLRHHYNMTLW